MAKTVEELEAEINKRFDGITNQQKQISDEIARLPGMSKAHAAEDRKSTRLNSSHIQKSRMPSSA